MEFKFLLKEMDEDSIKQNFELVQSKFKDQKLLMEWEFFDISFDAAVTDRMFKHNLGYQPKDVLVTRLTGPGALTFEYDKFNQSFIKITTTGACRARFFVGTYKQG